MRVAYSARLCVEEKRAREWEQQLAEQRKQAASAIDRADARALRATANEATERGQRASIMASTIERKGEKPLSCSLAVVRRVMKCGDQNAQCAAADRAAYDAASAELEPQLPDRHQDRVAMPLVGGRSSGPTRLQLKELFAKSLDLDIRACAEQTRVHPLRAVVYVDESGHVENVHSQDGQAAMQCIASATKGRRLLPVPNEKISVALEVP